MRSLSRWGPWLAGTALLLPCLLGARLLMAGQVKGPERDLGVVFDPANDTDRAPLDSLATRAAHVAPFRVDGRPSGVAYDPVRSEVVGQEYRPPKPGLVLVGLVGGSAPTALVDGIPGHDGPALLGVGDTIDGLKVRRIKEGEVTLTGMDTIWVLKLRGLP